VKNAPPAVDRGGRGGSSHRRRRQRRTTGGAGGVAEDGGTEGDDDGRAGAGGAADGVNDRGGGVEDGRAGAGALTTGARGRGATAGDGSPERRGDGGARGWGLGEKCRTVDEGCRGNAYIPREPLVPVITNNRDQTSSLVPV
jgi:hypothetical protein